MKRLLGLELELFMTKDDIPLKPAEWKSIVERAVTRGCPRIEEPYTLFALGALCQKGQFVLDNNSAVVEMVTLAHPTIDETIENLIVALFHHSKQMKIINGQVLKQSQECLSFDSSIPLVLVIPPINQKLGKP